MHLIRSLLFILWPQRYFCRPWPLSLSFQSAGDCTAAIAAAPSGYGLTQAHFFLVFCFVMLATVRMDSGIFLLTLTIVISKGR